jgi:hypothetical protein
MIYLQCFRDEWIMEACFERAILTLGEKLADLSRPNHQFEKPCSLVFYLPCSDTFKYAQKNFHFLQ